LVNGDTLVHEGVVTHNARKVCHRRTIVPAYGEVDVPALDTAATYDPRKLIDVVVADGDSPPPGSWSSRAEEHLPTVILSDRKIPIKDVLIAGRGKGQREHRARVRGRWDREEPHRAYRRCGGEQLGSVHDGYVRHRNPFD
jgi:hypothetical protein